MTTNRLILTQADKYQTTVYYYQTDATEVQANIVILHGMAEHHARYTRFIEFLCANGFDVYTYDHRGHGTDKKFEELGHFADKDGYKLVTDDAIALLKYVKNSGRGDSTILFGHSMGSLIARNVIEKYDDMDAVIICGTAHMGGFISTMGLFMADIVKFFKGPHHYSSFLSNLTTGYKDFAKISDRTAFDWLTRDNNIVGMYINDPYCGYLCTAAFYRDLIKFTQLASRPRLIRKVRRDLPILVISGSHDPVGGYGSGVSKYFSLLQKYGFTKSDCTIYEECRHELLNELNSDKIMNDILGWIERTLAGIEDEEAEESAEESETAAADGQE